MTNPTDVGRPLTLNLRWLFGLPCLPLRACQQIWNTWAFVRRFYTLVSFFLPFFRQAMDDHRRCSLNVRGSSHKIHCLFL